MVIIKVIGGLGNQMFQYALYRSFLAKGKEAKLDIRCYNLNKHHYGYELNEVFGITPIIASNKECNELSNDHYDLFTRGIRRYIKHNFRMGKETHITQSIDGKSEIDSFLYMPLIYEMDDVYLEGFWQSYRFFNDIKRTLYQDFKFKDEMDNNNRNISELMEKTNSVSIHVRRGDYLSSPEFKDVCTLQYYFNSIEFITKRIDEPVFYVFSDDLDWCKKNLCLENSIFVDVNKGNKSYNDMRLMSLCKHNIIANSTLSWWSAYLNKNDKKIVIAPPKWMNNSKRLI